jgi:hypothetical protein
MLFKKDEIYLVQTTKHHFLGRFAGQNDTAIPFIQFAGVTFVDEGKYTHFLKTGKMNNGDLKGAFSFGAGFWVRENWIMSVIQVGIDKKPDLKPVEAPVEESNTTAS